jgi:hypothetical protein
MAEDIPIVPELPGASPPLLSREYVAEQRALLADPVFAASAVGRMVRSTLDGALAATGQNFDPPPDTRSAIDAMTDRQMGIDRGPAGEARLPSEIGVILARDALSDPADPAEVKRIVTSAGRDYEKLLADARSALIAAGSTAPAGIKVESLSPHTLSQVAIWGQHLARRTPPKA